MCLRSAACEEDVYGERRGMGPVRGRLVVILDTVNDLTCYSGAVISKAGTTVDEQLNPTHTSSSWTVIFHDVRRRFPSAQIRTFQA